MLLNRKALSEAIPPGPHGYPLVGVFPIARRDPLKFFLEAARTHGDIVAMPFGLRRLYLISHPEHIKSVLQDHDGVYQKGPAAARVKSLFGDSLTTIDGERWRRRRQLMRPAFQPQRLMAMVPIIADITGAMLDRWQGERRDALGQPLDLFSEMTDLTRTIILRVLFGNVAPRETQAIGQALTGALEHVNRQLWGALGWLGRFTGPGARRGQDALRTLDALILGRVAAGRQQGDAEENLLSMLLQARGEETGGGLTDAQLCDELKALLVAGHTTTASGLAWVWYLLSQNPGVERRLQWEAQTVLGDRLPVARDLPVLAHTRRVIEEALRLYPPTWVTARTPVADLDIGGYRIPAHAIVLLSPYVTHRDPRFWEEPERFDPERFTRTRSAGRSRFAYFPFGAGPRACIGSALALIEMQLVVAMVARRYRLTLVPGWRVELDPGTTLRPRHGLRMVLHRLPQEPRLSGQGGEE